MPKRKRDDCDRIKHKIRKLEKKLRRKEERRTRSRFNSDDSESSLASRSSHRLPFFQGNDDMDFMELTDNEEVILNLEPPSPESQGDRDRAVPEPDQIASTSHTENAVPISSIVVDTPESVVVPRTTGVTIPQVKFVPPADHDTPVDPVITPVTEDLGLDSELLDILGSDPTTEKKYGKDIQKELSVRIQHWATMGLTKEQQKEFKEKYLTPGNAKLIEPPEMNAEIKTAVSDIVAKRDKAIEYKQKQLTSAITALGEAITLVLSAKERNTALLKLLMDSARIICDCQHADSVTRRNFLLNAVKKEVKEQLQSTKIDKFLFGENLAEALKSAKAINKSGTDLKPPAPKGQNKKPAQNTVNFSRNLNWKNPGPIRRQTGPSRMKEPAMTSTRSRPPNSSKQFQHPQRSGYNRR